ncbi:DUF6864 domain-containing function [Vibrio parahaemolyticus]|uniref:DUF6864 domain-containing function n=2 Tax=Vibrio TaxID=662 RepID=UPI00047210E0|nr:MULTISPECIES: hypothetical protein [Vibrio harveyi group]MBE4469014.1 hypothetical protein [Vibrio parahaemolyticus]MBS9974649.1 hypothetical protein [Vibrio alginolyticus]MBT0020100.1 hypothetical protein [Vibrio alginolyticus]MEA5296203.1 hypothetical protein [Vibrio parahaemolyticus]
MKITSGDLEVLYSGVVRTDVEKSIKFDLGEIYVKFIFDKCTIDQSVKPALTTRISDDAEGLIIEQSGFKGPLGSGWVKPVNIGSYEGRYLYLSFTSSALSNKTKAYEVRYTFFLGESYEETQSEDVTSESDSNEKQ